MGRKSKADERIPQILDAFERCIVRYGFEASSIPKIAQEAGVKHSIIRHYIGNRNALVCALVSRFTAHYKGLILKYLNLHNLLDKPSCLIAYFFDEFTKNEAEHQLFSQLFAAATSDNDIQKRLKIFYQELEEYAVETISQLNPEIEKEKIESTIYSLMCLWKGHTGLYHLGFGKNNTKNITMAAELLTDTIRR